MGVSVADIAAGMYALTGVLTALLARATSGQGTVRRGVDAGGARASGWGFRCTTRPTEGRRPSRAGSACRHRSVRARSRTADRDDVVYLGVQNEREWVAFCEEVLRRPDVASDKTVLVQRPSRGASRDLRRARRSEVLGTLSTDEVGDRRLDRARIALRAAQHRRAEFVTHPQLAARAPLARGRGSPAGPIRALVPPDGLAWPRMGRRRATAWTRCGDPLGGARRETPHRDDAGWLRELGYDAGL